MLFELFITIYLQIWLLPNAIFRYYDSEFEDNLKPTTNIDIMYYYSGLKCNMQQILRS
jgi:hypothetical protein